MKTSVKLDDIILGYSDTTHGRIFGIKYAYYLTRLLYEYNTVPDVCTRMMTLYNNFYFN